LLLKECRSNEGWDVAALCNGKFDSPPLKKIGQGCFNCGSSCVIFGERGWLNVDRVRTTGDKRKQETIVIAGRDRRGRQGIKAVSSGKEKGRTKILQLVRMRKRHPIDTHVTA
jgi:hypothetical protein